MSLITVTCSKEYAQEWTRSKRRKRIPMDWWRPSQPNEIQPTPWLHPEVIRYLDAILRPDWTVIEHGSGGSTLWLAQRAKAVTAIESNPDWAYEVSKNAPGNVTMFPQGVLSGFSFQCDLLLIDGYPPEARAAWLEAARFIVKPGGWVVLDNCNRPEYEAQRLALQRFAEYHVYFHTSRGGQKYLNSEFYRMP